ncbi:DUF1194 domain-containing protein [Microvirga thermotolerans]|uniref:DUF1194 domain-containing protein n=1 Tax=Microvirga thermotolerans TaxID=2651334 RepID=A0A5P9JWI3_9HYPH|nr:DUF1194 domain-containing protein [Microvirga thermotolerans]QFU17172.1 DUF1194 domain-containing protein [Microvirga thermotolerans]
MFHLPRSPRLCLSLAACLLVQPVQAEPRFDLALVIAVDVSSSMDPREQQLQRDGFVEAFRSPLVHKAIQRGILGRIAVTYVEWSSADDQAVVVPWTAIDGPDSASTFAQKLAFQPVRRGTTTSISAALDFSARLLREMEAETVRRVVDVSGDGTNNDGRPVTEARDQLAAAGITINGLPVMIKEPEAAWDMDVLDIYYRDCVIGGMGAFMQPVRDVDQFAALIELKILREVSGIDGRDVAAVPAASTPPGVDCRTGEKTRQERDRPAQPNH